MKFPKKKTKEVDDILDNVDVPKPIIKKKIDKPLTKQDKVFIREVVLTGNKTQAVKKAYGIKDDNYAGVKGNRMLRKDKIVKGIQSIADQIPDSLLVQKHLELLKKRVKVFKNNVTTGEIEEVADDIDTQAVGKGLELAYKLKGSFAPEKKNVDVIFSEEHKKISDDAIRQIID